MMNGRLLHGQFVAYCYCFHSRCSHTVHSIKKRAVAGTAHALRPCRHQFANILTTGMRKQTGPQVSNWRRPSNCARHCVIIRGMYLARLIVLFDDTWLVFNQPRPSTLNRRLGRPRALVWLLFSRPRRVAYHLLHSIMLIAGALHVHVARAARLAAIVHGLFVQGSHQFTRIGFRTNICDD